MKTECDKKEGTTLGFFSTLGDITLKVVGGLAAQSARNMERQSRRSDLSDEQRLRFADAKTKAESLAIMTGYSKDNRHDSDSDEYCDDEDYDDD